MAMLDFFHSLISPRGALAQYTQCILCGLTRQLVTSFVSQSPLLAEKGVDLVVAHDGFLL